MGILQIETWGSFPVARRRFTAESGGHAQAVGEAIQWLSEVALPQSIVLDHKLHDDEVRPSNKDFSRSR